MNERPAAMSERAWSAFQRVAEQLRTLEEIEREDIVRCLQEEFPELDDAPPIEDDECVRCGAVPALLHDVDSEAYCDDCAKHWGNW